MRITILQGAFLPVPPLRGGAVEKRWFELGKQFTRLGHSVCHVSRLFPGLPPEEVIEGVRHIRVDGYDTPGNIVSLKLLDLFYSIRALRSLPPADILITNTFWMPLLAGNRQHYFGRIMVDVARMPKGQLHLYRNAACLRANSAAVKKAILREVPYLQNRVCIIPNPLPAPPPALLQTVRQPVILYCGRLHPEKGIELLIEAFAIAFDKGLKDWKLRLVGPADTAAGGGGLSWLSGILSSTTFADLPIEWIGPLYNEQELHLQYQQAASFVYPSLAEDGETFGLAPLEAMACGAVPIVSDLACFRDFITSGHNGIVFNHRAPGAAEVLADQMIELAISPALRDSLSQAGLSVRQTHHPAFIAVEFLRCFEQLLEQSAPIG